VLLFSEAKKALGTIFVCDPDERVVCLKQ